MAEHRRAHPARWLNQAPPSSAGSFVLFEFDKVAPIVRTEHPRSSVTLHGPDTAAAYQEAVPNLHEVAMPRGIKRVHRHPCR
ncbi:Scr1 family TA system antitoxin-like transcriptional regulator [Halosaccharopolyspora lacisalsi]|uniref:Scr1 family TA system antitoxin-like transcriptional regulator n=1 Tax=Halosaccharopolyspora lacisalsi TaxID=1000566 RepID=UPI001C7237B8